MSADLSVGGNCATPNGVKLLVATGNRSGIRAEAWDLAVNCQLEFQLGKLGYFTEKTDDSTYPIG
jgi:hypothetical protein